MKFAGVFLLALFALLAVQIKSERCFTDDEVLPDGTIVNCVFYNNMAYNKDIDAMHCCELEGYSPSFLDGVDSTACKCIAD
ncbi:hypothetical protein PoB_002073400 [Plakobranchus ocellatus]|uniref:Plethodontid modulating factor n=1 Tax=Plakobranchus ocellatus TaxID=259542 RepID=A0AAV3ZFW2_9GAST|nr:hypothetical protein PoB_002073400 [Plakobranchus ocellatus]